MRFVVVSFIVAIIVSFGWGRVLTVPSQLPSIQSAITISSSGDTVLLLPGNYIESVSISHSIVFASQFLFSSDTGDVPITSWSPSTNLLVTNAPLNELLRFSGIHFLPNGTPQIGNRLFNSDSLCLYMDHCLFEGTYDSTTSYSNSIIYGGSNSFAKFSHCRFFGDLVGSRPMIRIYTGQLIIEDCVFLDRSDHEPPIPVVRAYGDSNRVSNSIFAMRGWGVYFNGGFSIDNCQFLGTGRNSIYTLADIPGIQSITNCVFDSTRMNGWEGVLSFGLEHEPIRISNCQFRGGIVSDRNGMLIRSDAYLQLHRTSFESFSGMTRFISSRGITIDSSQFIDIRSLVFTVNSAQPSQFLSTRNSDFIGCTTFLQEQVDSIRFDSVRAESCYWGDPTGPRHPLNQAGMGMTLPFYVNPFPFRTTPVFPETGVRETINTTYSLPNSIVLNAPFPNPFNNATTIRFSLPHRTDATIAVYDITGRKIVVLVNGVFNSGQQNIYWKPKNFTSGYYFIQLSTLGGQITRSVCYIK